MCRGLDALMLRMIGPPCRPRPCSLVLRNGPTRNRTENLLIKSQLLCQLSYRP